MKFTSLAFATLFCLALPPVAHAQLALKGCGTPKALVGTVRSTGTVAVRIDLRGHADPTSVVVTEVGTGTAAGLRSALTRQLPACTFRSKQEAGGEAWYAFDVRWSGDTLIIERPMTLGDEMPVAPVLSVPVAVPDEARIGDVQLEEVPKPVKCNIQTLPATVTVQTRVDGRVVNERQETPFPSVPRGEVTLEYSVTPQGRIDPASITLVGSGSPEVARLVAEQLVLCTFAPGRVGGIPVRTRMRSTERS